MLRTHTNIEMAMLGKRNSLYRLRVKSALDPVSLHPATQKYERHPCHFESTEFEAVYDCQSIWCVCRYAFPF